MLTLINSNPMRPPIAPIGLEYVGEAAIEQGEEVEVLDLCLAEDRQRAVAEYFADRSPELVAISFRNVDDCFLAGNQWFVDDLKELVREVRGLSDAPIVLGGVGFSLFPERIVRHTEADFGIHGDGEKAIVDLMRELRSGRKFDQVDGLVWRDGDTIRVNRPARCAPDGPRRRRLIDNQTYFRLGGQIGLETKRGCSRRCVYCPEPAIKGTTVRVRPPELVADEVEALLEQGIDVLHTCDSEFNIPSDHALAVCDELIRRGLGERVRWYAYLAVVPFDADLAKRMRAAGCVGINFTADAACATMLAAYRQPHRAADLERAVRLCRENGIAAMLDLLLGGPGETPETVAESIEVFKRIDPDCAGAGLGIRVYPGTEAARMLAENGPLENLPGIRRAYDGPVDLLRPTFYIDPALGDRPARLIQDLIGDDPRFFPPDDDTGPLPTDDTSGDHNYNDNRPLADAIASGERGAYWDILRKIRHS